jgi:hypothetical protein
MTITSGMEECHYENLVGVSVFSKFWFDMIKASLATNPSL